MVNQLDSSPRMPISLDDVRVARERIKSVARRTPLVQSPMLSDLTGRNVNLKLECWQHTGSFKIRGAANTLLSLSEADRSRGVITVSTGNHGRAVAYVAQQLGVRCVVCMSENVPAAKVEAIRRLNAEVVIGGESFDAADATAAQLRQAQGLTMIHGFDDPRVIAGQGTVGLEIVEDAPRTDTVIIPLSGGGLFAGTAFAAKSLVADVKAVGVTMERGPAMINSLHAGQVVDVVETPTLADALMGGLGECRFTFDMVRQLIDQDLLVSEEEIAAAMAFLLNEHHLAVEGGGAVGVAALLSEKVQDMGENVVVVISGGNVDMELLLRIAADHPQQQTVGTTVGRQEEKHGFGASVSTILDGTDDVQVGEGRGIQPLRKRRSPHQHAGAGWR
jgi:threonine dehydratase